MYTTIIKRVLRACALVIALPLAMNVSAFELQSFGQSAFKITTDSGKVMMRC